MKKHFIKQIEKDRQLIEVLSADLKICEAEIKSDSNQFLRRSYVRTLFSLVEAVATILRRHAMYSIELDLQCLGTNVIKTESDKETQIQKWIDSRLHLSEWALLNTDAFFPDSAGKLQRQEQKFPLSNYVAFSIRSYSKHSRWFDCSKFFSDNGWNEFKKAVGIRNRITHPKSAHDIELSTKDMATIEAASEWFQCVVHELSHRFRLGRVPDLQIARKELAKKSRSKKQSAARLDGR
jgi:hypothetical protein